MKKSALFSLLSLFIAMSCSDGATDTIHIYRLDNNITKGELPDDPVEIRAGEQLFEICGYGPLTQLYVDDYSDKESVRYHTEAVEKEFNSLDRESRELGKIFARIDRELPSVGRKNVVTFISPYTQSVIVSDSLLFIGLNHYLGTDYPPYESFPDYVRRYKVRDRLPIDVAEALVRTSFPFHARSTGEAATLVERLAYEGAVTEAVMRIAGVSEAEALGKDNAEMNWLESNERDTWKTMMERRMLFSTDESVSRSLCDDVPHSTALSPQAPGRTGRFTGHRIIRSYLKKKDGEITLEQLLSPDFYTSPALLKEAAYNP